MIETTPFGRTGHDSTRIIFGAAAFSQVTQDEADQTMELIRRHGINHLDTAASYGEAELRLGPWMADHRDEYFLATKTGERTADAAWAQINHSLERLQTDHVDLLQLHNLVDEEEWRTAFAAVSRWLMPLGEFEFDSVLLPYNFPMTRNRSYLDDFEALTATCDERGVAVQTIKAITRAPWGDREQTAATWYEPLRDQGAIDTAVAWVLGREGVFLNTVGDIHVLPLVLDAAERADGRPDEAAMEELERAFGLEPLFV
jgi:hypothetical protein